MSQSQQTIESERRVYRRLDDQRASLVELGANNSGIVLNISEGGMAVLVAEDLNGNGLGSVRFQVPEFEHWIEAAAEIAWINDSRKQVGICFKGLSETARTQLRAGISIATTRARLASQATPSTASAVADHEQTDPATPSSVALILDSQAPAESESIHTTNDVNLKASSDQIPEQTGRGEVDSQVSDVSSHPETSTVAPDSPLPDTARNLETEDKLSFSKASKEDESEIHTQTQLVNLRDARSQKIPPRPVPPAAPKSALAEMRFRNLVANSGIRQSSDAYKGIFDRTDFADRKWIAIGAMAILAALLAFLVGWILGDPSRMKLGH